MADIVLTVPPISGGQLPTVTLQEVPNGDGAHQVTLELDHVSVTFQGSIATLGKYFETADQMLQAFASPPLLVFDSRLLAGRSYREQARINTRRWCGR